MKQFTSIILKCVLILALMPLLSFGQSGYESFERANELHDAGNNEKAYKELTSASSKLFENPNKMSLEEAYSFFNLYEIITYSQGKVPEVDSVYLLAIAYGNYIQSQALQCRYTLKRGNLFRIKNEWKTALGILKDGLKLDCRQEDYIQIHAILGKCYNQLNFDSAQYYTMAVLPLAEQTKDTTNLMLLYNNLVAYYKKSNRKAQAFEYEKKSLEYEGQYPIMQVASSLSMAGLLTSMNNLSLAEEYIDNAENLLANKKDRRTIAQMDVYKARLEFARKNYDEAIKHIDLAYPYFVEKGYTNQIVVALSDKALFAKDNKDIELYEDCIHKLEEHIETVTSVSYKYAATSPVAKYYLDKNNPAKAKQLMDNLDASLDNIDWNNRDDFLEVKASIAKSEKNYLQSIGYLEQLNVYQDSMRNANVSNQIILSEQQYDREKKKQEINQLNVKADVAQANLNTSKWIIAISLFSLGLLLFFFYKLKGKNKKISEQQKSLNLALEDKDILLREIHHRVKNNLQVVSSLLNLQSNYISDGAALEAINEGKNRVSSMALIHQNLYQDSNLTSINSKEYFDNLIESLFESYNVNTEEITLQKNIQDLNIDVDTMIPLGLIVNELVSNALKHAYSDIKEKGVLTIELKEENGLLELKVIDNGIGMHEDQFFSSESFGNKMINAFKNKLKANIKIINDRGTSVSLQIQNYKLVA